MLQQNTYGLEILFEDNHVIVLNKKASDIVQGDKTGDEPLSERIKSYLKDKYQKPGNVFCGVVHRLDRPTSGALLFARTSKALSRMNEQFRSRTTDKIYWAVVEAKPSKPEGTLTHYLQKKESLNKSFVADQEKEGYKKAVLHYKLLLSSDRYHLLEIKLESGRHHQIRAQLAHIGCIIKGDLKYGAKRSNQDGSIHLHARSLTFDHPTRDERIELVAPVPDDQLWKWFEEKLST